MACPTCNKLENKDFKPFCSKRCADVDLGKWLNGSYSVPVVEMDDLPDDEQADGARN
jgi:endogenous inhibitor of DNA gyrase (YacG/DUF329 family)